MVSLVTNIIIDKSQEAVIELETCDELATHLGVPRLSSKIAGIGSSSCPPHEHIFFHPYNAK